MRKPPKFVIAACVAVAVALAGAATVSAQRSSSDAGFRTATVAERPVDETLERIGTIEPVAEAAVGFPVSGTVAAVDVAVGDQVAVGQTLAHLDTTSLDSAVADAQAALDQAELTLERALNGESVSSGPTGSSGPAPASYSGGTLVVTAAVATRQADDPDLTAAQQAVLDAQQKVDTDLAAAQQALDDSQTICAALTTPGDTTTTTDGSTDGSTDTGSDTDAVAACQAALTGVLDAQKVVAADQSALADASRALDQLLSDRAAASGTPDTSTPASGSPRSTPDQGAAPQGGAQQNSAPQGGGGATVGGSSSPTSAELIAYQKAVDAAAADVAVAQQAAAQATLVSPIAGTVQQVGVAVGDTVSAGSSTAAIVVVGDGGYEVTTTVTVDDLPDVEVGQAVTVAADGAAESVDGQVVGIGTVPTSSGSATTYPVTVGLTEQPDGFRNGATASLSIVTARTDEAVAVPTSAVTVQNGRSTVTVIDDGKPSTVTVQTGAVGDTWTEVTDGLDVGQTVVLADLDAPLPSSATDSQGITGGLGGFGGGGLGGLNRRRQG